MNSEVKQLKLSIKGQFKNWLNTALLNWKLRRMGVNVHDIKSLDSSEIKIHVSGDKKSLWQVVNWSKRSDVFVFLNEIIFEFADVA
jgi:hypothetical protein